MNEETKMTIPDKAVALSKLLCADDGLPEFLIKIENDVEYQMEFEVYEVGGGEENKETGKYDVPCNLELYLTGAIKWDGCSHIWFGEKEEGKQDGYLHLCGKYCWEKHNKMMNALFELAAKTIKHFDKDTAGA